eukprot:TRINITY_DN23999_c0_g1_i2.p1 TRINITY_DN23999_c0_g1~~TRINITY_DN23999_c0_g1_i2.p1  ORF type:complete len:907 (+),score=305.90 TRINITY_DN23999_c0_g1_i2:296-3016(+)
MTDGRGPICPAVGPPTPGNPYIIPDKPMCTRGDFGPGVRGGISELSFKCGADQCGCTTVSAQLLDTGVPDCMVGGNGGITSPTRIPFCPGGCSPDDCSRSQVHFFTVCITCVNDCPSYDTICDVTVNEDDQNIEILNWAFNIDKGAPNEDAQRISFEVSVGNPGLFKVQPYLVWTEAFPGVASLKFEPKRDVFGSSEFCVTIFDDGGIASGGCNMGPPGRSSAATDQKGLCCLITVNPVNDCPSFRPNGQQDGGGATPNGEMVSVSEDAGRVRIQRWASLISPGSDFGESGQNLWFNIEFADTSQKVLFKELPSIDPGTGDLVFELQPDVNSLGRTFEMYVQLQDDGGRVPPPACDVSCLPIESCPRLVIEVDPVNDPPFFIPGPDIAVCEDLADHTPPPSPAAYCYPQWAQRISAGAEREEVANGGEGQSVSFEVVYDEAQAFLFASGPAISPATGDLCFELAPDRHGTADVKVTIVDSGEAASTRLNGPGTGANRGTSTFARINVNPSNDPPVFSLKDFSGGTGNTASCLVVDYSNDVNNENNGAFSVEDFLTGITRGGNQDTSEAGMQRFAEIEVEPSTDEGRQLQGRLFETAPFTTFSGGTSARLSFKLRQQVQGQGSPPSGTIFYRVRVRDTGGNQGSGAVAGSCGSQDFTDAGFCITVLPSRSPPVFSVASTTVCVPEDSPLNFFTLSKSEASVIPNFFVGLDPACHRVDIRLGNNTELFLTPPEAASTLGTLSFTLARDMFGYAEVFATAVDTCVTPSTRSDPLRFILCVQPCNDPPEFEVPLPNAMLTDVMECDPATAAQHNKGCCEHFYPRFAQGITAGPPNEAGQGLAFLITPGDASPFVVPPALSPPEPPAGKSLCRPPAGLCGATCALPNRGPVIQPPPLGEDQAQPAGHHPHG